MSSITGTLAQLQGKVKISGKELNSAELSILTRIGEAMGFARVTESVASSRGKSSKVWQLDSTGKIEFKFNNE